MKNSYEKSPLASKKFVAFLVAEISWKVLAVIALFLERGPISNRLFLSLLVIFLISRMVEVGYILGQAGLDKYIRMVEIATKSGNSLTIGKVSIDPPGFPVAPSDQDPQ